MAIERWRPFGSTMERWQPLHGISDIQSEMNRLFESFFGQPAPMGAGEKVWAPRCDVWETKDEVCLAFEIPGVTEKDLNVSITGDLLTIRGERRFAQENVKDENWHRLERAYGKFERTLQLPMPVQPDQVKATYRDGLLTVRLPKADEVKPREIKIDVL